MKRKADMVVLSFSALVADCVAAGTEDELEADWIAQQGGTAPETASRAEWRGRHVEVMVREHE